MMLQTLKHDEFDDCDKGDQEDNDDHNHQSLTPTLVMMIMTVVVPLQDAVKSLRYLKKTRSFKSISEKTEFGQDHHCNCL